MFAKTTTNNNDNDQTTTPAAPATAHGAATTFNEKGGIAVSEAGRAVGSSGKGDADFQAMMTTFNLRAVGNRGAAGGKTTGTGMSEGEVHERIAGLVAHLRARMGRMAPSASLEEGGAVTSEVVEDLVLLFALAAHKRDIRSGPGERDIGITMLMDLARSGLSKTASAALGLIAADYGCFRDLNTLARMLAAEGVVFEAAAKPLSTDDEWKYDLRDAIVQTYVAALSSDRAILAAEAEVAAAGPTGGGAASEDVTMGGAAAAAGAGAETKADVDDGEAGDAMVERRGLSLAGKWAPRKGKLADRATGGGLRKMVARQLAAGSAGSTSTAATTTTMMHPDEAYRKLCTRLNDELGTVERMMERHHWRDIHPARIPGIAAKRHAKALRNVTKSGKRRRSDDEDRIKCAARMTGMIEATLAGDGDSGLKTETLDPVELVKAYIDDSGRRTAVKPDSDVEARWKAMVAQTRKSIAEGGGMPPCIPIADVSGSMGGRPMVVSIALGILLAEVAPGPFAQCVLPFSTTPAWVRLRNTVTGAPLPTLWHKVEAVASADWGGSTNFPAALELILHRAVAKRMDPKAFEGMNLVCLTDMQYDACVSGGWYYPPDSAPNVDSSTDAARAAFVAAGFTPPTIVVWNLRGDSAPGYAAGAHTDGVVEVAGYSQQMLKTLLEGGDLAEAGGDEANRLVDEAEAEESAGAGAGATEVDADAESDDDSDDGEDGADVDVVGTDTGEAEVAPEVADAAVAEDGSEDAPMPAEVAAVAEEAAVAPEAEAPEGAARTRLTPWLRLRRTLVSERYEPVRAVVREAAQAELAAVLAASATDAWPALSA